MALTFEFVDEILNFEDLSLNFCYLYFMRKEKQFSFFFSFERLTVSNNTNYRVYHGFYLSQNCQVYVGEKSTIEGY